MKSKEATARKMLLMLACDMRKGEITEALQAGADALSKQIPMVVSDIHVDEFTCPRCGAEISTRDDYTVDEYCRECGQRLASRPVMKGGSGT